MKCKKCNREIVDTVRSVGDARVTLAKGQTYIVHETAYTYASRSYCAFCGKWQNE